MNVLHVNTHDIQGGAARAAYRLHGALRVQGVQSQMLVQTKSSDDVTVLAPESAWQKGEAKLWARLDRLPVHAYGQRGQTLFSPAWVPSGALVRRINALHPDLVHLHWVAGGMLRIEDIANIEAPIVWSLHDMWAFTGGCHYDESCGAFRERCGHCKVLHSNREQDLSRRVFLRKQKVYAKKPNMTIVGLSRWMAEQARQSALLSAFPVVSLPNPIDADVYAPMDQTTARNLLNLPRHKKLVLFGAMGATSDPRKGFAVLSQALQQLASTDVELVVFGSSEPATQQEFKQKAHYWGHLHDDVTLKLLYSAADVMVVPSLQENLSNAIMESLACATPVVGFDIGGNGDLIDHHQNGYLAKPYEPSDLAAGIDWVLQHQDVASLRQAARSKVMTKFEQGLVARQYIDLYEQVLSKPLRSES